MLFRKLLSSSSNSVSALPVSYIFESTKNAATAAAIVSTLTYDSSTWTYTSFFTFFTLRYGSAVTSDGSQMLKYGGASAYTAVNLFSSLTSRLHFFATFTASVGPTPLEKEELVGAASSRAYSLIIGDISAYSRGLHKYAHVTGTLSRSSVLPATLANQPTTYGIYGAIAIRDISFLLYYRTAKELLYTLSIVTETVTAVSSAIATLRTDSRSCTSFTTKQSRFIGGSRGLLGLTYADNKLVSWATNAITNGVALSTARSQSHCLSASGVSSRIAGGFSGVSLSSVEEYKWASDSTLASIALVSSARSDGTKGDCSAQQGGLF